MRKQRRRRDAGAGAGEYGSFYIHRLDRKELKTLDLIVIRSLLAY